VALGGVRDLHAAAPHRGHVRPEIVALDRDVAEAAAPGEELGKPPVRGAGARRRRVATQAQELEVVLVDEGDGVLGGATGVDATGTHVEADAAVGGHAELEIRDGDHHVVDARQHGLDQKVSFAVTLAGRLDIGNPHP
jgi:hypothetical protein